MFVVMSVRAYDALYLLSTPSDNAFGLLQALDSLRCIHCHCAVCNRLQQAGRAPRAQISSTVQGGPRASSQTGATMSMAVTAGRRRDAQADFGIVAVSLRGTESRTGAEGAEYRPISVVFFGECAFR